MMLLAGARREVGNLSQGSRLSCEVGAGELQKRETQALASESLGQLQMLNGKSFQEET